MRKVIKLLGFLFAIYFAIQICFELFSKGHTLEYEIVSENTFYIKEVLTQNEKNVKDNYYFEIKINNTLFNLQTYKSLYKSKRAISDIKYFKNANYECILPIFRNNQFVTDIICKKDNIYYYYDSLKGSDPELDQFASEFDYLDNYENSEEVVEANSNLTVYNNIIKNHYVALETYKGIYDINKRTGLRKIDIFDNETYTKEISALVDEYYVVADYSKKYDFHDFYIVDLDTYGTSRIVSNDAISLNSYVQGVVGKSVYIFDKSNKKQYEINLKKREVSQIGNESIGIKYYENGEFVDRNVYDAVNEKLMFNSYSTDNTFNGISYSKVDKVGNDMSGYYYIYERVNNVYRVYRASIQNPVNMTYLFDTDSPNNVYYNGDYIYYGNGKNVYYFSELSGVKVLAKYNDIEFNKTLKIYNYIK